MSDVVGSYPMGRGGARVHMLCEGEAQASAFASQNILYLVLLEIVVAVLSFYLSPDGLLE